MELETPYQKDVPELLEPGDSNLLWSSRGLASDGASLSASLSEAPPDDLPFRWRSVRGRLPRLPTAKIRLEIAWPRIPSEFGYMSPHSSRTASELGRVFRIMAVVIRKVRSRYTMRVYVFVDESGDPSLAPVGASPAYYVICALVVREDRLERMNQHAAVVVARHAGPGELKSSNIAGNRERRMRILTDIAAAQPFFYSLAVAKASIFSDSGLRYRSVFYKFLHRHIYSRIRRGKTEIDMTADRFGTSDFMAEFNAYLRRSLGLFESHGFADSAATPLLQLADVVAGSVRRVAEGLEPQAVLDAIPERLLVLERWPGSFGGTGGYAARTEDDRLDSVVREAALHAVSEFVGRYQNSTEDARRLQVSTALLLLQTMVDKDAYLHRYELCDYIRDLTGESISEQLLTSSVLAPLRDAGVLLSSTERGVKLPTSVGDLEEYAERVASQVIPYVKRLAAVRNAILVESQGQLDVVGQDRLPELSRFINVLQRAM